MSTYVVDLDGTLCVTQGREYASAVPIPNRIQKINALYAAGHRILIDSARGTLTGQDWSALTEQQLRNWGVQYHDVRTGVKWYGDYYIDDKSVSLSEFFA